MSDLLERLEMAIATMMNDDCSQQGTEQRKRFIYRITAIQDAHERIEQLEAQLAKADELAKRAAEYAALQCDTYELASAAMAYRKARGDVK